MEKVDRALEMHVIDWLQWGEFQENLAKRPDGDDMRYLALKLISKRKEAHNQALNDLEDLKAEVDRLRAGLVHIAETGSRSDSDYAMKVLYPEEW